MPLKVASSPHCSSPCTPTTTPLKTPFIKLLKIANDTTLIGLIKDCDESAYRQEVEQLALWCSHNNLELNTVKTMEIIMDFRRNPSGLIPLNIMDSTVAAVETFKFQGSSISQDLNWDTHIASWGSLTCHRSCWNSSTQPSPSLFCALQ